MKTISILGSTGSIGTQTIEVCTELAYKVAGIAAYQNTKLLASQTKQLAPQIVCIFDKTKLDEFLIELTNINVDIANIKIVTGMDGLIEVAICKGIDITVNAVVGMIGLKPTLSALEAGIDVALANKEALVTGGFLVKQAAKRSGANIYPVDSEHSAIFQSLQGNEHNPIKKIMLTASGGPFFGRTKEQLAGVTVEDALAHPNWVMGAKITIDSATMMNKGLELIEACWLFNIPQADIEIVVHRESVIHSLVEFEDNAVMAQLGVPDMKLPIQYALTYPLRLPCNTERLSLKKYGQLSFSEADDQTFICLKACKQAVSKGGLYPTVVNGANERAVELFLDRKISFNQIGEVVYSSLSMEVDDECTIDSIIATDCKARAYVNSYFNL